MMWVIFFPVIAALYVAAFVAVVMLKAFVVLTYCLAAVAAWVIQVGAKVVVRYTT